MAHVVVQAGHCHRTTGATGTHREQEFTWALGNELRRRLEGAGHDAVLVLADAVVPQSDVFVALHTDGSSNRARRGASVGYPDEKGKVLASLWKREHQAAGFPGGWLPDNYTAALRGYYGFRKAASTPYRFLAEHGTTTNAQDEAWLFANVVECARAHVRAINALFPPLPPPPPPTEEDPVLTIVYAEGRASCLARPDGTLYPLRDNDEVRAYEAAGWRRRKVTTAEWDLLDAVSKRIWSTR